MTWIIWIPAGAGVLILLMLLAAFIVTGRRSNHER